MKKTDHNEIYLLLYVDDIILAANDCGSLITVKEKLKQFNMTDLGKLRMFLGIEINQSDGGMFLSQQVYTIQMVKKIGMEECKAVRTSMVIKPGDDGWSGC